MEHILEEIKNERKRQDDKFGEQNNLPIEWISILTEEVGEASKEAIEHHFQYNNKDGDPCSVSDQEQRLKNYRKELIECAAVCVNAIQSLERIEVIDHEEVKANKQQKN